MQRIEFEKRLIILLASNLFTYNKKNKFSLFSTQSELHIMNFRKSFVFLLLFSAISVKGYNQYYYYDKDFVWEIGASLGTMNCITDVGGANSDTKYYINEIRAKRFKFSGGIYAGVMYQNLVGLRLEGTMGSVEANDADITSTASLNLITKTNRNLNFRSSIKEIALLAEFHPLMLKYHEDGDPLLSPYATAGVGYYSFNPQTTLNGRTVDLQPLSTEGQGFAEYLDRTPYKRSQINLPVGIGLRYELNDYINLRLEFLHRILFTDYLDDASNKFYIKPELFSKYLAPKDAADARTLFNRSINGEVPARRGNPDNHDTYMSLSLKVSFVLGRGPSY
jgi:hypothetical protein